MEIGNEISQKIRSAIKAKLIEQGAYVDDELPDYIMVMVANKKSQKQMTDDLSLFLGTNTEKFTSWLHSLLKKLQSINTDEPNAAPAAPKPKTKEKVKGEKRKHRSSQGDKEKKGETDKQRKSSTGEKEKLEKKKVEDKVEPAPAKVKPVQKTDETTVDELNIIENTDEFNDENVEAEVKELTQSSSTGKPPPTKVSKVDKSTDGKKSGTKSSVSSSKTRSSSSSSSAKSRHDGGSSSRKKPSSIVASVKRRYEELDDEEEEYDPNNPAVGSVASVVRGPTRKSSIPKSLQANKSLLMKAVTEAEKSVTTKKVSPESKPAMRSDRQPVNLKHRLKTAAGLGLISRSKRAEMSQKYTGTSTSSQDTVKKPRRSDESFENMSYTIKNVSTNPPKKVSPKAPASAPVRVAATALRSIATGSKVKQEVIEADSDAEEEEYGPPLPDTRLVQKTNPDTDSNAESSQAGSPEAQPEQDDDDDAPDPEIQLILDEAHMTLDLNDDIAEDEYKYQIKDTRKSISPEPRFIVTLDGVDPDTYKTFSDVRQNPAIQTVKPVPKPKPSTEEQPKPVVTPTAESLEQILAKMQPPKIKPFNISLKDTDDEEEEEMETEEAEESKSASINERCRFWPACANGNECQFIHPSIPCKSFPYCKFGDKCLYIHPNCRFDANCTRMDCPYTHSCKRKGLMGPTVIHKILQVPVQQYVPQHDSYKPFQSGNAPPTQCRFYPNCRNMSCTFTHPKPCRYGIGCMNKNTCTFSHPALPGADKLKWTSKDKKSPGEVPVSTKTTSPATEAAK